MINIVQEKMSGNLQARCVMHICSWKGPYTTQQSCWDKISFECGQLLLFVLLCLSCCFEKSNACKKYGCSFNKKSANFILQGEPSESFQHLQWHPISTQLKAWWIFSLQTSFQGVWLWYISRILLERGGNLYQKKFFCLFLDPKTRRKQKLWSSQITRDF